MSRSPFRRIDNALLVAGQVTAIVDPGADDRRAPVALLGDAPLDLEAVRLRDGS